MLRTIFERVDDYAIFTLDARGHITSWANGCVRIKKFTAAEVLGKHYSMLYPEEGRLRKEPENHLRIAAREGRFRGEGMRQRKDGSHFLADVFITPMYEGEKLLGYFKVVTDLTERNRMIQERDLTRTRMESLEIERELTDRFIFMLSHDLRTPLSAAHMATQVIAREGCSVERHREFAHRALRNLAHVSKMVTDLLDASRVSAGQPFPMTIEECDLIGIVREVVDQLGTIHGDRFRLDGPESLVGYWHRRGLGRIFENLAVNAVKYGDPLRNVTIKVREVADRVHVSIHNFGSPLSAKDLESVFELFQRTERAKRSNAQGWGLGLTLVRGITEAHGGVLQVQSLPNEGTTFTVDLPRDARSERSSCPAKP